MKLRLVVMDNRGEVKEVFEYDCGVLITPPDLTLLTDERWRRARNWMWVLARLFDGRARGH